MDAQAGSLEAAPGSKENALELMNVSVQRLVGAAKNLVGAKNNPDQLGPRATELANAVQQVVNSGKAIAGALTLTFSLLSSSFSISLLPFFFLMDSLGSNSAPLLFFFFSCRN